MNVIARGTAVHSGSGTDRQSCAFPGICVLPSGRWLCGFRAAPTKSATSGQKALLTWSDDEGKGWSSPREPFAPLVMEGKPGLFRAAYSTPLGGTEVLATLCWVDHSDPALPFFNETTQGLLDTRILFSLSHDNGLNWSTPWLMDTAPFPPPTPFTGPVLVLPDGTWVCQFELNKPYYDPAVWHHSSVLMFSRDQGQSWPEHAVTSRDPANRIFYWDQRPGVLSDGRMLDLFWTYDNAAGTYLTIHARESLDCGRTWSELWDTGVPGQPAPPVSLPDGRVGMVYVDRTGAPVIKLRASADGGRTWPQTTEIQISESVVTSQTETKKTMQDAWSEMGKFSIGLPATALTPTGDVLVVYYAGARTDQTDIKWARLRI